MRCPVPQDCGAACTYGPLQWVRGWDGQLVRASPIHRTRRASSCSGVAKSTGNAIQSPTDPPVPNCCIVAPAIFAEMHGAETCTTRTLMCTHDHALRCMHSEGHNISAFRSMQAAVRTAPWICARYDLPCKAGGPAIPLFFALTLLNRACAWFAVCVRRHVHVRMHGRTCTCVDPAI